MEAEETVLDIKTKDEVAQIGEWYYDTQNNLGNCRQNIADNATYYYQDEKLVKAAVKEGAGRQYRKHIVSEKRECRRKK